MIDSTAANRSCCLFIVSPRKRNIRTKLPIPTGHSAWDNKWKVQVKELEKQGDADCKRKEWIYWTGLRQLSALGFQRYTVITT